MPSGLSARMVAVCTLVLGVTIAHAERRPVAVIDLSGEAAAADLAAALNPVLQSHPELLAIPDPQLPPLLYGPFVDDDDTNSRAADAFKRSAETELAAFQLSSAEQNAERGQASLHRVVPSGPVLRTYSQLAFLRGQAMLGLPKQLAEAPAQFALAHRLDPSFVPDAARYLPDVVQAFADAQRRWPGTGTLAVVGHGRLWVDGREIGAAPVEVEVDAGPHVIWLAGDDRMTSAQAIIVDAAPKQTRLEIADEPADLPLKVRRARAALRKAPDAAARGPAMTALAALVGVRDAVLLTAPKGYLVYQTWCASDCGQKPGFSKLEEVKDKKPIDLLEGLAPAKPKVEQPKIVVPIKPPVEKPWYARRPVQATIALGVVAALIGGYYLYKSSTGDTVVFDNDIISGRVRW